MFRLRQFSGSKWGTGILASACIFVAGTQGHAQELLPSTAVPVVFTRSLKAGKVKPGEQIVAKTMQAVLLANGGTLPAGTPVVGHIVRSSGFAFDSTPYAVQKPSVLAIHFDDIAQKKTDVPVELSVRAIAGPVASHEAAIPHYRDEIDTTGTRILIGGDRFSSLEPTVTSSTGEAVGYFRNQGVFARLQAARSSAAPAPVACDATTAEQSVAIFSPDACGTYGVAARLIDNGASDGSFVLESSQNQPVQLYAGTTALLETVAR